MLVNKQNKIYLQLHSEKPIEKNNKMLWERWVVRHLSGERMSQQRTFQRVGAACVKGQGQEEVEEASVGGAPRGGTSLWLYVGGLGQSGRQTGVQ